MELKKEKEDLALEVEREEELLTNTLQKKLNQVRARDVGLLRGGGRQEPEWRYLRAPRRLKQEQGCAQRVVSVLSTFCSRLLCLGSECTVFSAC